jgi:hypothetical protein
MFPDAVRNVRHSPSGERLHFRVQRAIDDPKIFNPAILARL